MADQRHGPKGRGEAPEAGRHHLVQVGVVPQERPRVLLTLPELIALVGVPGAGLGDDPLLDPEIEDYPPVRSPEDRPLRHAMSNSFGFGGTNGTLVFRAFD